MPSLQERGHEWAQRTLAEVPDPPESHAHRLRLAGAALHAAFANDPAPEVLALAERA